MVNAAVEIRDFVQELLRRRGDTNAFGDSESLLQSGRLQSIDATEIVVFLETHYGVDFSSVGFDQEIIDSIDRMVALV